MKSFKKDEKIPGCGYFFVRERGVDGIHAFEKHRRLRVFFHKGLSCVTPNCQNVGNRLIFSRDSQGGGHWDLFTDDMVLMTIDHITAKKNGGSNELENLQPMCCHCNTTKGHQVITLDELAVQMLDFEARMEAKKQKKRERRDPVVIARKREERKKKREMVAEAA
jgi:hypothetical protein